MNNLKPNMYIRTKEGKIDKVLEINTEDFDEPVVRLASYPIGMYQGMFEYKKASHNLIDLIEEGDFVNGERVIALKKDIPERNIHMNSKGNSIFVDYDLSNDWYYGIDDEDIKSIVTKEQFKSISYEVSK